LTLYQFQAEKITVKALCNVWSSPGRSQCFAALRPRRESMFFTTTRSAHSEQKISEKPKKVSNSCGTIGRSPRSRPTRFYHRHGFETVGKFLNAEGQPSLDMLLR
jgi:hypothetical protein